MTIPNLQEDTVKELLPLVQSRFPLAVIQKILFSPERIIVPQGNFKFVIKAKKGSLKVDHTLPVSYTLGAIGVSIILVSAVMSIIYGQLIVGIGGVLWIILGVMIMKYLFRYIKKDQFAEFKNELTAAITHFDVQHKITNA